MHSSDDKIAEDAAEVAGLEYHTYDETAFNPRLAIRYSFNDNLIARASWGTGFRVPYLFAEDLHLCASSPRIYKGTDLSSEKSSSISGGFDWEVSSHQVGFNLFMTRISDKIEFIDPEGGEVPEGYDFRWANAGDATTSGVELYLIGVPNHWLEYGLDFGYTIAKYDEKRYGEDVPGHENSDYIPRTPAITAGAKISAEVIDPLELTLGLNYTGSMYIDHVPEEDESMLMLEKTDAYTLINARIAYALSRSLKFYINVDNLTDYIQPTRDITDAAYMYAPIYGRTVSTGFTMDIGL
jgi:outer membrane receptor for ferrienterochelin and colicins